MWPRSPSCCTNPLEGLNVLLWRKSWISGTRVGDLMLTIAFSPLWKSKVYSPQRLLHLGIPWIFMSVWLSGSEQSWSCLQCPYICNRARANTRSFHILLEPHIYIWKINIQKGYFRIVNELASGATDNAVGKGRGKEK